MTTQTNNTVIENTAGKVQEQTNVQQLKGLAAKNNIKSLSNVSSRRGGFISIVKATNGTRISINKHVNKELGYPTELFVGIEDEYLLIFNATGLGIGNAKLKSNTKDKLNIYNTALVDTIIKEFNLDYSDKTSQSFADGHFKDQGRPVLYVKMV